ncbi:MAG: RNA methyltransferase [Candidatus Korobacteraceae bacterium]
MSGTSDRLCVVLVGASNPLNIGAAARAMSNFGFLHLRVVNAYEVAFREAKSAVGAVSVLTHAEEFTRLSDAVADCTLVVGTTAVRHRELQHPLRRLEYGARLIRKELATGRVALMFGPEKTGLSNDDLSYCHWLMNIPTREQHISMNLGQAVAVCLYELVRDGRKTTPAKKAVQKEQPERRATAGEVERISDSLLEALHVSGYVKPIAATSTEERVRRLVRRMDVASKDAELWLGMLRQMLWKIRSGEDQKK